DDTIPIILLLYILQSEACVIHHSLIYILDRSFSVQYVNVCRNGVDDQAQIAFVRSQRLLGALPLVDVRQQNVPAGNTARLIAKRHTTVVKPPIFAVEAPQ